MTRIVVICNMGVLIVAGLLSACSSTPDELESFEAATETYEKAIRWREFRIARKYHKELGEYNNVTREKLKQIRVTRYSVIQSVMEPDLKKATQVVDIRYYNDLYARERDITVNQIWVYDDKRKHWQLTTPFPEFE